MSSALSSQRARHAIVGLALFLPSLTAYAAGSVIPPFQGWIMHTKSDVQSWFLSLRTCSKYLHLQEFSHGMITEHYSRKAGRRGQVIGNRLQQKAIGQGPQATGEKSKLRRYLVGIRKNEEEDRVLKSRGSKFIGFRLPSAAADGLGMFSTAAAKECRDRRWLSWLRRDQSLPTGSCAPDC